MLADHVNQKGAIMKEYHELSQYYRDLSEKHGFRIKGTTVTRLWFNQKAHRIFNIALLRAAYNTLDDAAQIRADWSIKNLQAQL